MKADSLILFEDSESCTVQALLECYLSGFTLKEFNRGQVDSLFVNTPCIVVVVCSVMTGMCCGMQNHKSE